MVEFCQLLFQKLSAHPELCRRVQQFRSWPPGGATASLMRLKLVPIKAGEEADPQGEAFMIDPVTSEDVTESNLFCSCTSPVCITDYSFFSPFGRRGTESLVIIQTGTVGVQVDTNAPNSQAHGLDRSSVFLFIIKLETFPAGPKKMSVSVSN